MRQSIHSPGVCIPAPLATPDFIYATKESKHSNRPVETVTPLAKALKDLHIHYKHADHDYQIVVDAIFGVLPQDQTSSPSIQHFGIEVAEFEAGVVGGELPIDADMASIAAVLPDAR